MKVFLNEALFLFIFLKMLDIYYYIVYNIIVNRVYKNTNKGEIIECFECYDYGL